MIIADGNLRRKKAYGLICAILPFASKSVDFISHTLKHLYLNEGLRLLREMRRIIFERRSSTDCRAIVFSRAIHARGTAALPLIGPRDFRYSQSRL